MKIEFVLSKMRGRRGASYSQDAWNYGRHGRAKRARTCKQQARYKEPWP
jgi:hypothetical protein